MNEPALYRRANNLQRNEASKLINEFVDVLQLRPDGKDSLMDVGCGTGDVLMDFILPILPKTYSKVFGVDISPRMIQYSKETCTNRDRVEFKVLDIGTDKMPLVYHEQFDHVTSFLCLHWIQNQRQALKNIYNMLIPGGDCLLLFIASAPMFDVFLSLAANPKWSEYMKDVEQFIPPTQNNPDPWHTYMKLFVELGFIYQHIEIRQKPVVYEGYEKLKDHATSVNPFVERIPLHRREEYVRDICDSCKKFCLCEKMSNKDDHIYTYNYKLVVIYAKK